MTTTAVFLAAALPDRPSLGESLGFQLTGLVVVFLALGSIWVLLEVMGLFFRRGAVAEVPVAVVPRPAAPAVVSGEVTSTAPEVVAAITAAVHETLGPGYRIAALAPGDTSAAAPVSTDRIQTAARPHVG